MFESARVGVRKRAPTPARRAPSRFAESVQDRLGEVEDFRALVEADSSAVYLQRDAPEVALVGELVAAPRLPERGGRAEGDSHRRGQVRVAFEVYAEHLAELPVVGAAGELYNAAASITEAVAGRGVAVAEPVGVDAVANLLGVAVEGLRGR